MLSTISGLSLRISLIRLVPPAATSISTTMDTTNYLSLYGLAATTVILLLLAALVHFKNMKQKHRENDKQVENAVQGDTSYIVPETPKPDHNSFDNKVQYDTSYIIRDYCLHI